MLAAGLVAVDHGDVPAIHQDLEAGIAGRR
jgi:hypothetical protein